MASPPSVQTSPPDFDTSFLKFYSFGLAANNLPMSDPQNPTEGANILQVTPIEHLTMLDGELGSIPVEQEIEGKDSGDNNYISKVTADTAIAADWLPGLGVSNRRTPPNIRRGERVLLFQYADTDQFYWVDLGLDGHLRKLETVIWTFSGTSDEAVDGTTDGNCYSFEVSTHTGQVTIKTSKVNGEYCEFGVQLNAKEGKILIVDDLDNELIFDSALTKIRIKNADGTIFELDKKKIYGYAAELAHFKSDENMLFQTKTYKIESETYRLECETGSVKGRLTFEDEVQFNKQTTHSENIQANGGLRSPTVPVRGPTETLD